MIIDHTETPIVQLLVDRTRRATMEGPQLAAAHRAIGNFLAADVVNRIELAPYEIEHPTGPTIGVRISPGASATILALLRAGLFLAEGIWEQIPTSSLVLHQPGENIRGLGPDRGPVVIVDAVINTGRSIRALTSSVGRDRRVVVVVLTGFRPTIEQLVDEFPEIDFVAARLSERSYVGRGQTDTGSRLFGTTGWDT
jgi:uracil phosphoribosyltransferase